MVINFVLLWKIECSNDSFCFFQINKMNIQDFAPEIIQTIFNYLDAMDLYRFESFQDLKFRFGKPKKIIRLVETKPTLFTNLGLNLLKPAITIMSPLGTHCHF